MQYRPRCSLVALLLALVSLPLGIACASDDDTSPGDALESFTAEESATEPPVFGGVVESYGAEQPQRGHLVVFTAPNQPDRNFTKRIIAMPEETVEVRAEGVYINGELLDEPYVNVKQHLSTFAQQTVPSGHYFVLGDNRNNSVDSRTFGFVPHDDILGRVRLD